MALAEMKSVPLKTKTEALELRIREGTVKTTMTTRMTMMIMMMMTTNMMRIKMTMMKVVVEAPPHNELDNMAVNDSQ